MHSPDPWKLERLPASTAVVASDGSIVMKHHYGTHQPNDPEFDMMAGNLERIVACVNAMTGITDPQAEIERLRSQADSAAEWKERAEHFWKQCQ